MWKLISRERRNEGERWENGKAFSNRNLGIFNMMVEWESNDIIIDREDCHLFSFVASASDKVV